MAKAVEKKCKTCRGTGIVLDNNGSAGNDIYVPCSDCESKGNWGKPKELLYGPSPLNQLSKGPVEKAKNWQLFECVYDEMGLNCIKAEEPKQFNKQLIAGYKVSWLIGTPIECNCRTNVRVELEGKKPILEFVLAQLGVKMCIWTQDNTPNLVDYKYPYETSCGNAFELTEGTPKDNDMVYCPYCKGKIEVKDE